MILSKDVTPENNALVPLWNAMGPAEVPRADRAEYFRLLGVKPPAGEWKLLSFAWKDFAATNSRAPSGFDRNRRTSDQDRAGAAVDEERIPGFGRVVGGRIKRRWKLSSQHRAGRDITVRLLGTMEAECLLRVMLPAVQRASRTATQALRCQGELMRSGRG